MWSYTDEENSWLESRRAADIAPKAVVPTPLQIEHYIREGEKLRAEAKKSTPKSKPKKR